MREIGGYIEIEHNRMPMLYNDGIKLNCGRNSLLYLIKAKKIKEILFPKFMCDSCDKIFNDNNISIRYYSIDFNFKPIIDYVSDDEWIYIVNYYGQLSNEYLLDLKKTYKRIIVDNAQAYFQSPVKGVDTFYTCRKFFGVADGAILYTDVYLREELPLDYSYDRMNFLLGRYEKNASEFYGEYVCNNEQFLNETLKHMSLLTDNLLHGINYEFVKNRRTDNFKYLHSKFAHINKLELNIPKGAFMYPLLIDNSNDVRKKLLEKKIYIPTLWPSVFDTCDEGEIEYRFAKFILPLPIDQRYSEDDMAVVSNEILNML